ncbi:hypothetical protein IIA95_04200 [Patescibacteria group bacterium]|nr:hypothetical protein [Patescibacteria group bacterium]
MKKFIIYSVLSFLVFGGVVFAAHPSDEQVRLPNAGITPGSPFFFLDRFVETLQEFFVRNPEGRARLQITFAAERVAEIRIIFDRRGIDAEGVKVAQVLLENHLANAAAIVQEQKTAGEAVGDLAADLSDTLFASRMELKKGFRKERRDLENQEDQIKIQLRVALRADNQEDAVTLRKQLQDVRAEKERLEAKEEELEDKLEAEEERFEDELEDRTEAQRKIRKAEREKEEIVREAEEEGIALPAGVFGQFDNLLDEAKSAFDAGNFREAERLARLAKDSLDDVEDIMDDLEDALDDKEDAEEAIQEAEEELEEVRAEAADDDVEISVTTLVEFNRLLQAAKAAFAAENFKRAEELAERAEDALDEVKD